MYFELLIPLSLIALSVITLKITSKLSVLKRFSDEVLIVIAHPDDESMFFGPTIISLIGSGHSVYLLCLSSGDYYGNGNQRVIELEKACDRLGISDVTVIDDKRLRDSQTAVWDNTVVNEYVNKAIQNYNIKAVISFDCYGVSGHQNHRHISHSIRLLNETDVEIYELESISLFRKYLSFFELPITLIQILFDSSSDYQLSVISFSDYIHLLSALHKHRTQMVWFRYLYSISSRYMFINAIKKLN